MQQISAIRGAVNGFIQELIKSHLIEHFILEEGKEYS
ncbi:MULTISPECIES: metal-sensing transcriptional repressor [Vibrio]|nr:MULTISPECIES: metal-sensing transcriptional repressor [Vibrio]MBF4452936.1 metal-sensing transcriptional repressor [Vibrio vulnificus]MBF4498838.1 metal-sensing transcriptional repressor [Vibrio vulnificus]MBL6178560.1 metal-sensing transcriptional repressor [Vibrio vulnificus]HDY7981259.1 metal-sensing transcriptional repressor [Vibrio vulnificus]HDY8006608.1 metal-sensing transcriptional repressor [Vibrio vulnificus]